MLLLLASYGGGAPDPALVVTRNGRVIWDQNGVARTLANPSAPNAVDLGETVSILGSQISAEREVSIQLPVGDYSAYSKLTLFWYGRDAAGQLIIPIPAFEVQSPEEGRTVLGFENAVLKACAGTEPDYELCITDTSSRMGYSRGRQACDFGDTVPLDITTPPTLDTPTEDQALTGDDPVFTADGGVTWVWVFERAKDNTGTDAEEIDANEVCPVITDGFDHLRRGARFTGLGVPDAPDDTSWSDWEEITPASVTVAVTLATAAIIASNTLPIDGIVGVTPVAGMSVASTASSATIVDYVSTTGRLYLGTITGPTITDNTALTWTGTPGVGIGNANGDAVAWQITGGEPFYILPPTFNGTPTEDVLRQEIAADSAGTGALAVELSGSMPPYYGTKWYRYGRKVSGYGITPDTSGGTYQTFWTSWTQVGIPTLSALTADDWYIEIASEPGGGTRVAAVWVLDSLQPSVVRWTTSNQGQIDANPYPSGHELCTSTTTLSGGFRRWTTSDAIYSGKNYVIFLSPDDDLRRQRFGVVAEIGGARTPMGDRKTVGTIATGDSAHARFIQRSQLQAEAGDPGGNGMQFPRAFDCEGDYIAMSYDVTYPSESTDFGANWYSEEHKGLYVSQSTVGICVDEHLVHGLFSAYYMRQLNTSYRDAEGYYQKDRNTGLWGNHKSLINIFGSNENGSGLQMRRNLRYICKIAGSGSGPTSRTLYMIHNPGTSTAALTTSTIQLYKSTNGGTTWATDGAALNVSTYGVPFEIWADATAIYMNTHNGVYRRPVGSATWTQATGLPSGRCLHLEKRGTTVYVGVDGQGLYTATDATTLAFTVKRACNFCYFSVCPTNTSRIIIIMNTGTPIGTHDNGANWFNIVSQQYPGQAESFQSAISGNATWVMWHDTDTNRLVAMRRQHMGKSDDGGRTFYYASHNNDYSEIRSMAFDYSDHRRIAAGMTDRLYTYSDHGIQFVVDDNADAVKDQALVNVGLAAGNAATAGGMLILRRGDHIGAFGQIGGGGGANNTKTPVLSTRTVATTRTDQTATGNGAISVSASTMLPAGAYTLRCTAAAANGGTFTGTAPMGVSMGTWTVGTARTWTHPRGGTLAVTISDGSTDFTAGANPCVFTIRVNPVGTQQTPLNPATKDQAYYSQANPAVPYRGISGRHVFEMTAAGVCSLTSTIGYSFAGYMGPSGTVILGYNGASTLMRSTAEGASGSWTTFVSGIGSFNGIGKPVICASSHDSLRAYTGHTDGTVKRHQNGVTTTIFSLDTWAGLNSVTGGWPGSAGTNVRKVPITGVQESWFNPNLLYCTLYLFGAPYMLFRTKDALATTPTWENVTVDAAGRGVFHPIQDCFISPVTDELVLTTSHGNIVHAPEQSHRTTYGITVSMIDDLRAGPGGIYHSTAKL